MKVENCQVLVDKSSSGRVRPWAVHRLNADYIAMAYDEVDERKAERMRECAKWLTYRRLEDGSMKLHDARFCRVRLCPVCQWRRALKTFAQMSQVLERASAEGYSFLFLTLTMRNVEAESLSEALDKLLLGFNRLTKYKRVREAVRGFYRGCEVTHNTVNDTYHPHLHVVLAVKSSYFKGSHYISQADWSNLWRKALQADYDPIVDIRKCHGGAKAIAEACKYAVKPSDVINVDDWDMTVDTLRVLDGALDRRRFVGLGGIIKEIYRKLFLDDDIEDGDLLHVNDKLCESSDMDLLVTFWWNGYARRYETE